MTENITDSNAVDADVWGTTRFRPGADVGLVSRHTVGLIARDNPSTRERLWGLVADDAPLDDILDELSSTGLKALPDFGVVQTEGDTVRVVARGRVTVTAELATGDRRRIDASDVRTWIEEVVGDVVSVTITLPPGDHERVLDVAESDVFAVLAGSVPASEVTRRFDEADRHAVVAASGSGWSAAPGNVSGDSADEPEPEAHMPDVDLEMPADSDQPSGLDTDSPAVVAPSTPGGGDSWFDDAGGSASPVSSEVIPPQPSVDDAPRSALPGEAVPAADATDTADPMDPSGALSRLPPSGPGTGAAPPVADIEQTASPGAPPVAPAPPVDSTVVRDDVSPPVGPPAGSLFDDTAGSTQTFTADRDGMTVSGAELDALRAATPDTTSAAASDDSQVYAVLAFSNGERVEVDRAVLIGRNPKVAGSVEGGLPHIMKFDGPGQGLSRTHAEVRVEDGDLVLEDLQSTNGTEVLLPGQVRRRLLAGEPVVIVPGTLIDFGDELHCTVESAR